MNDDPKTLELSRDGWRARAEAAEAERDRLREALTRALHTFHGFAHIPEEDDVIGAAFGAHVEACQKANCMAWKAALEGEHP